MYQNRAASHERMERWAEATSDCDLSIKNNNKYDFSPKKLTKKYNPILTGTARHWTGDRNYIESRLIFRVEEKRA